MKRIKAIHEQVQFFGHVADDLLKQSCSRAALECRTLHPKQSDVGSKLVKWLELLIASRHRHTPSSLRCSKRAMPTWAAR